MSSRYATYAGPQPLRRRPRGPHQRNSWLSEVGSTKPRSAPTSSKPWSKLQPSRLSGMLIADGKLARLLLAIEFYKQISCLSGRRRARYEHFSFGVDSMVGISIVPLT